MHYYRPHLTQPFKTRSGWLLAIILGTQLTGIPIAQADKVSNDGSAICALPGKDGVLTGGGQVNTIHTGTSASVSAGSSSLNLGPSIGSSTPIQAGDLLLVIQMQGADINANNNDTYGDGNSSNNFGAGQTNYTTGGMVNGNLNNGNFTAGNFEYVVALNSINSGGGTLNISTPLVNSYSNANATSSAGQRRFQVIRVPQYANATITTPITAPAWNGTSGGIVAIDVAGTTTFSGGSINMDGQGFRGGGGRRLPGASGSEPALSKTDVVTFSTSNANGSKGEGTAGTPKFLINTNFTALDTGTAEGYPNGSYGRGAPGTAGGGGTDGYPDTRVTDPSSPNPDQYGNGRNSGGGGGSNGGIGGKGGRTWSTALPYGGDGGAAFPATPRRLVLGGGGGAGTTNNGTGSPGSGIASSGGHGGGIIMLRSQTITGTGTLSAKGIRPSPATIPAQDAAGGGGAGGSILVLSETSIVGVLSLTVGGGNGGSNTGGGSFHGPGGGGGGGVVFSSPSTTIDVGAGTPGSTQNGSGASSFGGATAGFGFAEPTSANPSDAVTMIAGANCLLRVTKATSTPGPMLAPNTATYTITVSNPNGSFRTGAEDVIIGDVLPAGFTHSATAIAPVYQGGATGPSSVTSSGTASQPSWQGNTTQPFRIPSGGSIELTFTVTIAAGTASGTYQNSASAEARYINPSAGVTTVPVTAGTVTANYNGNLSTNTADDVTIGSPNPLTLEKTVALVDDRDGSGGTLPLANQIATPGDILEYRLTVTNNNSSSSTGPIVLTDPIPANATYVPGSLTIASGPNSGPKTDLASDDQAEVSPTQVTFRLGTGANGSSGGTLGPNGSGSHTSTGQFRIQINDPVLPSGTNTISNQANVSTTGYPTLSSNDPTTSPPNDPTVTRLAPRVRLVKRITGVKRKGSTTITPIGGYYDIPADPNDHSPNWPGGSSTRLLGVTATSQLPVSSLPGPGDEIEYTIHYLSDGAMNPTGTNLCDFIPNHQSFVSSSLELNLNGTTTPIADTAMVPNGSGFYPATTTTWPTACSGTNNGRGAVHLSVGNLPLATASPNAYGFFRFRAKVD